MAPSLAPAHSSAQGTANRHARSETTRSAIDTVAKFLSIALAGVLFLWTPSALSDSDATMDSPRAQRTDGADARAPAGNKPCASSAKRFPMCRR